MPGSWTLSGETLAWHPRTVDSNLFGVPVQSMGFKPGCDSRDSSGAAHPWGGQM
jgi:hypothetical protein